MCVRIRLYFGILVGQFAQFDISNTTPTLLLGMFPLGGYIPHRIAVIISIMIIIVIIIALWLDCCLLVYDQFQLCNRLFNYLSPYDIWIWIYLCPRSCFSISIVVTRHETVGCFLFFTFSFFHFECDLFRSLPLSLSLSLRLLCISFTLLFARWLHSYFFNHFVDTVLSFNYRICCEFIVHGN